MKNFILIIYTVLAFALTINAQELTQSEIDILKENPELINEFKFENSSQAESTSTGADKSLDDLSAPNIDSQNQEKFGFDFIKKIPQSISSTSDLPVPNDYILALGDELKIILTGGKREIYTLAVELDGSILFPELGAINVFGESISSVRKKIENLIDLSYVGTEVSVGIEKLSARKINIVGAVENPGTFIINPFSTITSALSYSGGFSDYASVRDIQLIRGDSTIFFDLYDLLISGNRDSDINIQQGDTILVNSTNNFVSVQGSVNRPLIYEFKDDETISDIVNFAMGLKNNANPNKLAVIDYSEDFKTEKITEVKYDDNVKLKSFNSPNYIEVFNIESSSNLQIKVLGPLENKGFFEVAVNENVKELLPKLKFTEEINPYIAVLQSNNSSSLFSLNDDSTYDLDIPSNSELIFFSKNEDTLNNSALSDRSKSLLSDYALKINYPGLELDFPFYGVISASDIVDFLGLDMSGLYTDQTYYLAPLDNLSILDDFSKLTFKARKYNSLTFREKIDSTVTVTIDGQVTYPGTYTLKDGATLNDLYDIVGGYNSIADRKSTIFRRDSLARQNLAIFRDTQEELKKRLLTSDESSTDPRLLALTNIEPDEDALGRISGDLSMSSKNVKNFLLENGDTLFIPKKAITVSVLGEVMKTSSHVYEEGMSLRDAVNLSGGYTQRALKNSTYIIRSNGSIVRPARISRSIDLMPGDTVVVPTNFKNDDDFLAKLVPLTSLLSNLAFSAAAIDNLRQ